MQRDASRFARFLLFLSLSFFLVGFVSKIDAPRLEWEHNVLNAVQHWSSGINTPWIFEHPPLYPILLTVPSLFFGATYRTARITNAFCILLTAWLIFKLTTYLSNRNTGRWAASFYLLSPSVIQGSLSMDVADANFLPLGFVLFVWSCTVAPRISRNVLQKILIGLTTAFCFWAKVTASIGLFAGILTYPLIIPMRKDREWPKIVMGFLLGGAAFIVMWISISLFFWGKESCLSVLLSPWRALGLNLVSSNIVAKLSSLGLNMLRIIFWLSPFFLMLAFWQYRIGWRTRNEWNGSRFFFLRWISFFYFIVFCVVGGTNWGFPRYHLAILPVFIVLVAIFIQSAIQKITKKEIIIFMGILIFLVMIYTFVLDDILLLLNVKYKEAVLFGEIRSFAVKSLLQGCLYIVFPFLLLFLPRLFPSRGWRERLMIVLIIAVMGSFISMDIRQCRARYSTSSQYGAEGKETLVSKVSKEMNPNETVLATAEILYALNKEIVALNAWEIWKSNEMLLAAVRQRPGAIIMGLTTHPLDRLQYVFHDSKMQVILDSEYTMDRIGTYFLWTRKR